MTRTAANILFFLKRKELRNGNCSFLVFTGTAGKTTTRDALAFALRKMNYEIESNELGYSNELGVLFAALGITRFSKTKLASWIALAHAKVDKKKTVLIELGADFYHDIPWFLKHFTPQSVFLTGIADFDWAGSADKIYTERIALLRAVPKTGYIFYDANDAGSKKLIDMPSIGAKKISYSVHHTESDVFVSAWTNYLNFMPIEQVISQTDTVTISYNTSPHDFIFNRPLFSVQLQAIVSSIAYLLALQITPQKMLFADYTFSQSRLQFSRAKNGATILSDIYKSTPMDAFWFLKNASGIRADKKILVLTELRPLGKQREHFYNELASLASFADMIFFIGPVEDATIIQSVLPGMHYITDTGYTALSEELLQNTTSKSLIVLKGSIVHRLDRLKDLLE